MTLDDFLRDKVYVSVPTLATAVDLSVDYLDLEIKRGHLELVGEGRLCRIPAESARKWLLALHEKRTAPVARGGGATKETSEYANTSTT